VRDDILLHSDDGLTLPATWSVDEDFPSAFEATLRDENGQAVGRLLTTGEGTGDSECNIPAQGIPDLIVWTGFEHDDLNKDGPSGNPPVNLKHQRARALATLQTSYEWCRFIYKTGLLGGEGLPLALWVKRDGSPHPQLTPCAPKPPGREEVTVTVESVRVLHSGDDPENQPGEVNLVLVAYDSPFAFHRSARSESGQVRVRDGEFVDATRLPHPVTLCLNQDDTSFRLAVHGWDDDDDSTDPFYTTGDFDDIGDDDEVLLGFQQTWGPNPPTAPQTVVSEALEVTYRMETGTDSDGDGLGDCDEQIAGSNPENPDSDADGLTDGTEVNGSNPTNPLDSDSDDDGLLDGQEDANHNGALDLGETNPNNPDSDADGLTDGTEVNGSNPTNPLDSDLTTACWTDRRRQPTARSTPRNQPTTGRMRRRPDGRSTATTDQPSTATPTTTDCWTDRKTPTTTARSTSGPANGPTTTRTATDGTGSATLTHQPARTTGDDGLTDGQRTPTTTARSTPARPQRPDSDDDGLRRRRSDLGTSRWTPTPATAAC
jgi:hypothetical protein